MASAKGTPMYEFYSNVQAKEVEWLWHPYIPYGKLTVLQGDPGEGKSTCLLVERHREYKRTEGLKFSGKAFIRKISECVGWDLDKRYVVIGEYDESNRSIDFDLTTASCDLQG